jgi:hypothetical protein
MLSEIYHKVQKAGLIMNKAEQRESVMQNKYLMFPNFQRTGPLLCLEQTSPLCCVPCATVIFVKTD